MQSQFISGADKSTDQLTKKDVFYARADFRPQHQIGQLFVAAGC